MSSDLEVGSVLPLLTTTVTTAIIRTCGMTTAINAWPSCVLRRPHLYNIMLSVRGQFSPALNST